jgi:hypothetical protein
LEVEKTKKYLTESKVVGHLFSEVKSSKSKTPLIVGLAMTNENESLTDVHIKTISYKQRYLDTFIDSIPIKGNVWGGMEYKNKIT